MDAFIEGARTSGGGISDAERTQIDAMRRYQVELDLKAKGISTGVTPTIASVHQAIATGFGQGADKVGIAVGSGSSALSGIILRGYGEVDRSLTSGSSGFVGNIGRAYQAEQERFRSASAVMEERIRGSKGAEKEALICEYDLMKREHEAKSRAIQGTFDVQGRAEAAKIADMFEGNASAAKKGGGIAVAGTKQAYGDMTKAQTTAAGAFSGVLGGNTLTLEEKQRLLFDRQKDMMIARTNVLRSVTRQSYTMLSGENEGFARNMMAPALDRAGTTVSNAIIRMHEKIRETITRQTDLTRAAIRTQASVISSAASPGGAGASGYMEPGTPSTSMSFESPFSVGAYAADSFALPDYTAATGQARAYAAATGSLLDLFGSNKTLSLTSTQERALNLTVTFTGFSAALSAPIGILERVANMMWESARYERQTALINRETAEINASKRRGGAFSDARFPPERKVKP